MTRWPPHLPARLTSAYADARLIFVAAAVVRIAIVAGLGLYQVPFRAELHRIAASLATTGVYGNPYAIPTGPSAHVSPADTLLVAAMFRLFGTGTAGELAVYALNIVLAALLYAALPWAATRLGLPRRAGVAAGWFGALVPFHFLNELRAGDAVLSALALMAVLVTARPIVEGQPLAWRYATRLGLVWGFGLLTLPPLLGVIATIAAIGLSTQRHWPYVLRIAWSALLAILILSPWALRNRQALGETVWFRSNLGTELRLSYNDFAWPDIERNARGGAFDRYYLLASDDAARELRQEGEVAYNERQRRETIAWVEAHPTRSLSLVTQRIVYFWVPRTLKPFQSLFLSVLSVAAIAGFSRLRHHHRTAWLLLLATWVSLPPVYYVIHSSVRYRYPMIWTLLLAGSVLLHTRSARREAAGQP